MDVVTNGSIVTEALAVNGMKMRAATMTNGIRRILGLPGTVEQKASGTIANVFVQGCEALAFENVVLTTANARSIIATSEATSINEELRMKNDESADAVRFDLSGRHVKASQKGIVIVNGKKLVVK